MRVSGEGEAAKATVAKRGRTEPRDLFIRKWDLPQGGKRMGGEDYCGLLSIEDKEEKKQETRKKRIQMKNVSQHLETGEI